MEFAKTIYSCEHTEYDVCFVPDIVYAHRETRDLKLQFASPERPDLPHEEETFYNPIKEKFARWHNKDGSVAALFVPPAKKTYPLVIFCAGSGWAGSDGMAHVQNMFYLAKHGFAVCTISYRGTYKDNVVFPAAVQDLKEAVRFMRKNHEMFHIDPERIGIIGDSSGGNTVAMAALTDDSEELFNIGENLDVSSAVQACTAVYPPVDLLNLVQDRINEHKNLRPEEEPWPQGYPFEAMEIWQDTYEKDPEGCLRAASPFYKIEDGKKMPPFLLVIGDDDQIIPVAQVERFVDRIRECGGRAEAMKVIGGKHGTGVWSKEMLDYVTLFFKTYIG